MLKMTSEYEDSDIQAFGGRYIFFSKYNPTAFTKNDKLCRKRSELKSGDD